MISMNSFTRFLKWLVSRRMLRCYLSIVLVLVTLVVLFYAVENYRGAKAWQKMTAELNADGVSLDIADSLAPPVPDEENFCAIPLLRDLPLVIDGDTEAGESGAKRRRLANVTIYYEAEDGPRPPRSGRLGEKRDLAAWRNYFEQTDLLPVPDTGNAAADIIEGMKVHQPVFDELTSALDRKYALLVPRLEERLRGVSPLSSLSMPYFSPLQSLAATLKLRAIAAARNADGQTAVDSLRIMCRLAEATGNDSFLLGWLVESTFVAVMERGVWELLNERTANAERLLALESQLSRIPLRESLLNALKLELIMSSDYLELAKSTSLTKLANLPADMIPPEEILPRLYPDGWWDQNKVTGARLIRQQVLLPISSGEFEQILLARNDSQQQSSGPYSFMSFAVELPWRGLPLRLISQECLLLQMGTACALERFYIANGSYPENLDALMPDFLSAVPLDPVDQKPMRYHRTEDGRYVIYSVGYDQRDDNGRPHPKGKKEPDIDQHTGIADPTGYDWVWRYSFE
jgi:hypothetical protein